LPFIPEVKLKELQIKKKHHYVWSYYLKGWSADSKNVWYISKKGKPSFDSVKGIARENDFYKVGVIEENDLKLMGYWLRNSSDVVIKLHHMMVESIRLIQSKVSLLNSEAAIDINFEELIASNLFENYLSMQEDAAVTVLQNLREGNVACLDDRDLYWSFSYYLGFQFSRTKRMRDALLISVDNGPFSNEIKKTWRGFYKRHWWFMCSFFGTNIAGDIALNKNAKLQLLVNLTKEPFITSDQPVININPEGQHGTEIDYYYPISSQYSIVIINSGRKYVEGEYCNVDEVLLLNSLVAEFSGDTIISSSEDSIIKSKVLFNKRTQEFK